MPCIPPATGSSFSTGEIDIWEALPASGSLVTKTQIQLPCGLEFNSTAMELRVFLGSWSTYLARLSTKGSFLLVLYA